MIELRSNNNLFYNNRDQFDDIDENDNNGIFYNNKDQFDDIDEHPNNSSKSEILFGDKFLKVSEVINPIILQNANEVINQDKSFFVNPEELRIDLQGIEQYITKRKSVITTEALCVDNKSYINFQNILIRNLENILNSYHKCITSAASGSLNSL